MKESDPQLNAAWWALRIGLGVGPILAGIDKYFNTLANDHLPWPLGPSGELHSESWQHFNN